MESGPGSAKPGSMPIGNANENHRFCHRVGQLCSTESSTFNGFLRKEKDARCQACECVYLRWAQGQKPCSPDARLLSIHISGRRAWMALSAALFLAGSLKCSFRQGDISLSTSFPNRFQPVHEISPRQIPSEWSDDILLPSAPPVSPKPAVAPGPRAKKRISRKLTPHKIGVAWEKVRKVVRDMSLQSRRNCPVCFLYGNPIEFQPSPEYHLIVLELKNDRIVARIAGKERSIRIVRIRSGGSGYEFRKKIRTATWVVIELMREAHIKPPATGGAARRVGQ